ncbi:hypothetical protein K450DRAFT_239443 [Umbelopsis ramanniana AG]|uniref:Uncharacterized protein n=1 Tax=Umbelopsis ramanniana AG TaxID=1314678 RepID=A0AAD5EB70_UMBRA|nr:uncharacterized protein K450DRAFT_239443 [Umbelopsis ramanniana AG]KAI8580107.1 hypothetical protein K450DRAFT_239443 [Umbelopsis ramanniana AG]
MTSTVMRWWMTLLLISLNSLKYNKRKIEAHGSSCGLTLFFFWVACVNKHKLACPKLINPRWCIDHLWLLLVP